jgi:hypothetical protein
MKMIGCAKFTHERGSIIVSAVKFFYRFSRDL